MGWVVIEALKWLLRMGNFCMIVIDRLCYVAKYFIGYKIYMCMTENCVL